MPRLRLTSSISVLFAVGLAGLCAGGWQRSPSQVGDEAMLLEAAKDAELHGVAVSSPAVYTLDERSVKAWPRLVKRLCDSKGEDVARVRGYMSEDVFKRAAKPEVLEWLEDLERPMATGAEPTAVGVFKGDVVRGFSEIIEARDFYDERSLKGLDLSDELKGLVALGTKRTMHQTSRMNWGLLRVIFPDSMPDLPPGFRTIRVQVRAGKAVVLVLSSSGACYWDVDVTPGSKVTGVVLCGCHTQEVALHDNPLKDVPTIYRAGHAPDGTPTYQSTPYLDGYELSARPEKKFVVRKRFEAGVKELTGKAEFVSIQRESSPKTAMYFVPPKEKK